MKTLFVVVLVPLYACMAVAFAIAEFGQPPQVSGDVLASTHAAAFSVCGGSVLCGAAVPCAMDTCTLKWGGCEAGGGTAGTSPAATSTKGTCGLSLNPFDSCPLWPSCGNGGTPAGCDENCAPIQCTATGGVLAC